jgi:YD repeat-containing protein
LPTASGTSPGSKTRSATRPRSTPTGNPISFTDRDGHRTTFKYDALDRQIFTAFGTAGTGESQSYESTINNTYDAGNRLTQAADSSGGTFSLGWDEFDELTSETGPQGTVTYAYDAAGRRASMSTAGQPEVTYSYDAANQLVGINSLESVALSYDAAGRRTSALLPGSVQAEYSYDQASRLTAISFHHGASTMGDLNYAYDPSVRMAEVP